MTNLNFSALEEYAFLFLRGAGMTLWLSVTTTLCGIALGLLAVRMSTSTNQMARLGVASYVEVIRNTPFLMQMFVIFFALPVLGIRLNEWWSAFLAMTINLSAYSCEIIRAGVQATSKGQNSAGLSLGLTRYQSFVHVVLPQAIAKVYPALKSQILLMMLASAVVSQISVRDLSYEANFIQGRSFMPFEVYILTAAIYFGLSLLISFVLDRLFRNIIIRKKA
jgi:polar amino acid transport system permease protein